MSVSYVVYGLGSIISYLNIALIYSKLKNTRFKINILNIVILTILGIINAYGTIHFPIIFKPIFNLTSFTISIYLASKEELKSILYYVFAIWFVGNILDIVCMALFSVGLNYLLKVWPNWGIFVVSLVLQLLLNLIFRVKFVKKPVLSLKRKLDMVDNTIWLFIISVLLVAVFSVLAFSNLTALNNVVTILFLLIIATAINIYFIRIRSEEKIFKTTVTNLLANNKYYLDVNTQDRIFKHNIIHRLNSIKSVANDKAISLIDDLINDYNLSSLPNKSLDMLPNGINGLISSIIYGNKNKSLNIAINNYLESDLFDVLTHRRYNKLCEILGICLDNALSASSKSKEKVLQIVVLENENQVIIKIINTFKSSLEVDKLGTINYSTKKGGHGLGLYSLFGRKDILVKTSIINNLFENQITVKKIKKAS